MMIQVRVIVFNQSDAPQNIVGWKIRDKNGWTDTIKHMIIGAGDAQRIFLSGNGACLGNAGGEITLLNTEDTVAVAVSYGKSNKPEGWSLVFK